MQDLGRILLLLGVSLAIVGALLLLGCRVPFLGRLPGDIRIERGNWSCFFPLATSLLLSLLLSIVLNVFIRLFRR